ncbi:heparinase II/III domain-containing protein [Sedimentisphaera salicampi]|uniref:Heparinase II/III-like protein n=1 Tax=Sedimentisphaera salicampi TaxID=1941349 RepID=A0A1W6LMQ5_9BACT|nr:heparinase II/III family protein [Sedimentisphaera salicampi]ARN57023.1 Heparinase II/III-like protein [Sedimentisphaera salicampi]
MSALRLAAAAVLICSFAQAGAVDDFSISEKIKKSHPRITWTKQRQERLNKLRGKSKELSAMYHGALRQAENMLDLRPVEEKKIGRRLLSKSRETIERVLYPALCYRITGQKRFLKSAEAAMLNAAGFKSWNPSHFLDVGEMSCALGFGLDWLYNDLPEDSRKIIADAIIEKGLKPSLKGKHWWARANMNWNQVCNGGLTIGALAVYERAPEIAGEVIKRAVKNIPPSMEVYEPNGSYPEGPGYWKYGTSYNVIFLDALQTALGTDFGLSEMEGFSKTGEFYSFATGLSGRYFNYSDGGSGRNFTPAAFWLAGRYDKPSWTDHEIDEISHFAKGDFSGTPHGRFFPLSLLWAEEDMLKNHSNTSENEYFSKGINPIAIFRTKHFYLGLKGGTPSANHAHMDAGSFVLDTEGVRWAADLGSQSYHGLEKRGIKLWQGSQNGQRWTIFRLNNYSHNTLVVDGKLQRVKGFASVGKPSPNSRLAAQTDLSEIYEGQLESAIRKAELVGRNAVIKDSLSAGDKDRTVRWAFMTKADIEISGSSAILKRKGQELKFKAISDSFVPKLEIYSAKGPREYDAENKGAKMLGFKFELKSGEKAQLKAVFTKN